MRNGSTVESFECVEGIDSEVMAIILAAGLLNQMPDVATSATADIYLLNIIWGCGQRVVWSLDRFCFVLKMQPDSAFLGRALMAKADMKCWCSWGSLHCVYTYQF